MALSLAASGMFVVLCFHPIIAATGGLWDGYSTGERIGFITKASVKGIVFKTNEIQIQVGTGDMAALQEPQSLSVPDNQLYAEIVDNLGKRGRFQYDEWLIQPYSHGESGYDVTGVEWDAAEMLP